MAINFFSINGTGGGGGGGPTVVNTNNGISGDGSVGSPVVLGGNPMNAFTDINIVPGTNLRFVAFDGADQVAHLEIDIGLVHLDAGSIASGLISRLNIGTIGPNVVGTIGVTNAGNQTQGLEFLNDDTGLVKDQANGIGLQGEVLFPIDNPNQYAQYGNIAGNQPISKNVAQVTTSAPVIYTASLTSNQLVKVNAQALFTTFGAGAILTVSIDYTDTQGNAQNVPLGVINTADPSAFPPVVLGIHDSNTVILSAILSGTPGAVFDLFGNVEVLGNI